MTVSSPDETGECRFCGKLGNLCLSHAIPDAFFRPILRRNNGAAIGIPKGRGKVRRSSDTGKAKLLCEKCESKFNKEFDKPLTECLKELDGRIVGAGFGARVSFSHDHLARCIASVFWRACISSASMYQEVRLSLEDEQRLYRIMVGSDEDALRNSSVRLLRLNDPTPPDRGGFTQECVSDFVLAVSAYRTNISSPSKLRCVALDMCVQGFLIHLFFPRIPHGKVRTPGFLRRGARDVHAPPTNLLKYPPLMNMMVAGFAKNLSGEITPSVERNRW